MCMQVYWRKDIFFKYLQKKPKKFLNYQGIEFTFIKEKNLYNEFIESYFFRVSETVCYLDKPKNVINLENNQLLISNADLTFANWVLQSKW